MQKKNKMKKLLLLLFLFSGIISYSQNRIKFQYDVAGNQTGRVICINCTTAKNANSLRQNEQTVIEQNQISEIENTKILFYPNPVQEELHLEWKNNDTVLSKLLLYNLNGQLVRVIDNLHNVETVSISFLSLPEGYYNLTLNFINGESKSLKILKNKN